MNEINTFGTRLKDRFCDHCERDVRLSARAKAFIVMMMFLLGTYLYNFNSDQRSDDLEQYYSNLFPDIPVQCQCSDSRCICTNVNADLPEDELLRMVYQPFMFGDADEITFVAIEEDEKCTEVVGGVILNKDDGCIDDSLYTFSSTANEVDFEEIKNNFANEIELWRKYFVRKIDKQKVKLRKFLKGDQN